MHGHDLNENKFSSFLPHAMIPNIKSTNNFSVYSAESITILPNQLSHIDTGTSIALRYPTKINFIPQIASSEQTFTKYSIGTHNLIVPIYNNTSSSIHISTDDNIADIIIQPELCHPRPILPEISIQ